jgi:hypothetical protein
MKTMKIFFALSLAIILFAFNSNNANAATKRATGIIKYQVMVHVDPGFNAPFPMIVTISDENGKYVDHPQIWVDGTMIYGFTEPGPVTGIRTAQVSVYPPVDGMKLDEVPDIQKGTFDGSKIYIFNVYLTLPPPTGVAFMAE